MDFLKNFAAHLKIFFMWKYVYFSIFIETLAILNILDNFSGTIDIFRETKVWNTAQVAYNTI